MRYLVTGATGFAGPHMINRILEGGDEVVAMARNLDTCRDIVNIVGEEAHLTWTPVVDFI